MPVCRLTRMSNGAIDVEFDEVEVIDLTMEDGYESVVGTRESPIDLTVLDDDDGEEEFNEYGMDDVETDCSSVSGSEGDFDLEDDDASESIGSTDTWSTSRDDDDKSCRRSFIVYDDDESRRSLIVFV